jgi:hypothetical protein
LADELVVLLLEVAIGATAETTLAADETTGTRVVGATTGASVVVGTTTGTGVVEVVGSGAGAGVELVGVCWMRTAGASVVLEIGVLEGAAITTGTPSDVKVATARASPVDVEVP